MLRFLRLQAVLLLSLMINSAFCALKWIPDLPLDKILEQVDHADRVNLMAIDKPSRENIMTSRAAIELKHLKNCGKEALKLVNPALVDVLSSVGSLANSRELNFGKLNSNCISILATSKTIWGSEYIDSLILEPPATGTHQSQAFVHSVASALEKALGLPNLKQITVYSQFLSCCMDHDTLDLLMSSPKVRTLRLVNILPSQFHHLAYSARHSYVEKIIWSADPIEDMSYVPLFEMLLRHFPKLKSLDIGDVGADYFDNRFHPAAQRIQRLRTADPYAALSPLSSYGNLKGLEIVGDIELNLFKRLMDVRPALERLAVSDVGATSQLLKVLPLLNESISSLTLEFSKDSRDVLSIGKTISSMPHLEELELGFQSENLEDLSSLFSCRKLRSLRMSTPLSPTVDGQFDRFLEQLASLDSLEILTIEIKEKIPLQDFVSLWTQIAAAPIISQLTELNINVKIHIEKTVRYSSFIRMLNHLGAVVAGLGDIKVQGVSASQYSMMLRTADRYLSPRSYTKLLVYH